MGVMTAIAVGAGIYTAVVAKQQADDASDLAEEKAGVMADLEADRQAVVNPYANVTNPYANLSVATQAAKFQSEEADKALANTLDTMRSGGFSAGGATALARAAADSKKGVAASIESQEAQNERLKAQGAMQVEQMIAQGEGMKWKAQEEREMQKLDRTQAEIDNARAQEAASNAAMMGAIGNIGSAAISGAFNTPVDPKSTVDPNATPVIPGVDPLIIPNQGMSPVVAPTPPPVTSGGWAGILGGNNVNTQGYSDRRLKQNITQVGKSDSGLNIYTFEYKDKHFGEGVWQGVMSDEIPKIAVIKSDDGYDKVDYSKLDVEFKKYI